MAQKRAAPILTEDHWQAILKAAAPLSVAVDTDRARRELEGCLRDYAGLRRSPEDLKAARKEWRQIDKLLADLAARYHRLKRQRDLLALEPLQKWAKAVVEAYDMRLRARQGRRDPARDWLIERLFDIWTDCFGAKLAVTTPPSGGQPRGPLIRFIHAVLTPLTPALWEHDLPSPGTIRKLVRQERRRRAGKR